MSEPQKNSFEESSQEKNLSLPREIWGMLAHNKKWWLIPILIVFALFGLLLILGSTGAAPFIYTLF